MIHFLTIGIILGLSAGFAPGPLLTLVISETLQNNIRSGIKVALAPIITDLPIVLISLVIIAKLTDSYAALGLISLGGGLLLLFLGWQGLKTQSIVLNLETVKPRSLTKGILTNFLSPHPYLFWISIGAPSMTNALHRDPLYGFAFLGGFYLCLIGAKISVALLTEKSRVFLTGSSYRTILRCLGLCLIILAGKLFYDGLQMLHILP